MPMKNSGDTIENRTRDLPVSSAVPQPTVPPRASSILRFARIFSVGLYFKYYSSHYQERFIFDEGFMILSRAMKPQVTSKHVTQGGPYSRHKRTDVDN
jgi:hypothetical protein